MASPSPLPAALALLLASVTVVLAAEPASDAERLFATRLLPLFKDKCLACHGNDPDKIKADYDMRAPATAFRGGESGVAAVIPGAPENSPLYLAATRTHEDWEPMPPKENDKLTSEQVGWIKEWIAADAPWPDNERIAALTKAAEGSRTDEGVTVKTTGALSPDWAERKYKPEGLWAYQPVPKTASAILPPHAERHPIDALIAARMPKDIIPAPPANPREFIRRATFDLLGLPPTPEEAAAFEAESSREPQAARRTLIERLLASPHYGERWARHWLDVVRYADTSGFANDYDRGNAWRYRDYVVRAFNSDKPYNQFIKEQIAGDELAGGNTADPEHLVATGFLRMGPWELTGMEVAQIARQRFLDDVTNSVGETFLAHSLQCARCHDHKFDPVPTHDYYAIQACFATTQLAERPAPFLPQENTAGFDESRHLETRAAAYISTLRRLDKISLKAADAWFAEKGVDRSAWDQAIAAVTAQPATAKAGAKRRAAAGVVFEKARSQLQKQGVPQERYPPKHLGFAPEDYGQERVARKGLERLEWELERYKPTAFAVYNGRTPNLKSVTSPMRMPPDRMTAGELEETAILGGGDPFSPTTKVQPGVLSAIAYLESGELAPPPEGSAGRSIPTSIEGRRTALAEWIANPRNPLTTRAIVNRIWLWHFGQAIAGNPNNFGSTGKLPTHPELLDWLAATFVDKGWSIKEMHRLIMTSAAYQRSAAFPHASAQVSREDLEKSYAAFKPRRLSAEELRDSMLAITGELNPALGGIPNRPEINVEVAMQPRQVMGTFAAAWVPNPLPSQRHRRSLYAQKIRGLPDPFMEVFNEPGPDFSCEAREVSTVTPQVFSLFNSQGSYARALALADRVLRESTDGNAGDTVRRIFLLTYQRAPADAELQACLTHWQQMTAKQMTVHFDKAKPPLSVTREAVEENTGEKFVFTEPLPAYADFVPDLPAANADPRTRALADVCLVLLNANEFSYVY